MTRAAVLEYLEAVPHPEISRTSSRSPGCARRIGRVDRGRRGAGDRRQHREEPHGSLVQALGDHFCGKVAIASTKRLDNAAVPRQRLLHPGQAVDLTLAVDLSEADRLPKPQLQRAEKLDKDAVIGVLVDEFMEPALHRRKPVRLAIADDLFLFDQHHPKVLKVPVAHPLAGLSRRKHLQRYSYLEYLAYGFSRDVLNEHRAAVPLYGKTGLG